MSTNPVMERIESNAQALIGQYPSANRLLQDAINEAVPWAMPLATQGRIPSLDRIERLATQLIAIVIASSPSPNESPKLATVHNMRW